MMDRLGDVCRHVEGYLIRDPLGEGLADIIHHVFDPAGHLDGVGTGEHGDIEHGGVASVNAALGGIGRSLERHPCNILHTYDRTVIVGAEHYILEFGHRRQTASRHDRHSAVYAIDRRLAEDTGGRLAVLVLEGVLQVLDREAHVGEFVGFDPYLHRIVASADVADATHAGDSPQQVEDIERGVVAQIDLVKFRIVGENSNGHELSGGLFLDGYTVLDDFGGKTALGLLDAVLDVDRGQFGVSRDVESHQGREATGV